MGKKDRKPRRIQSLAGPDSVRNIPHLKIIDFGFGKMRGGDVRGRNAFTPCGTTRYMAPEMVEGRSYSQAVDMWSCGCILHFMLFGKLPFSKSQVQEGQVSQVDIYLGRGREISPQAKDLLFALLSKKKEKRATAFEALSHPWFTDAALKRQRSNSEVLPLSKVSLSPGENLAKVLSKMREEEDREEEEKRRLDFGAAMKRPSPISVFDKFESQASKEKTISILRLHLAEQLQVPARSR